MSKFKAGDVVKRKDGLPIGNKRWGDTVSETAIVIKVEDHRNYFEGREGFYADHFLELAERAKEVTTETKVGSYYNFPFKDWSTVNDMIDYMSQKQWGWRSYIFKDIIKACFRFGEKEGTTEAYDAKKTIYYGCRLLMSVTDKATTRKYLQQLLDDKQFKENEL